MTVVLSATISIYSVSNTVRNMEDKDTDIPQYFISFEKTMESVMWSTFGLLDMPVRFLPYIFI